MRKLLGILVVLGSLVAMADHGPYEYIEERLEHTYFTVTDGARTMKLDGIDIYPVGQNNIQITLEIEGSKGSWNRMNKSGYDAFVARIAEDVRASANITGRVTVVTILDKHFGEKEIVSQRDY